MKIFNLTLILCTVLICSRSSAQISTTTANGASVILLPNHYTVNDGHLKNAGRRAIYCNAPPVATDTKDSLVMDVGMQKSFVEKSLYPALLKSVQATIDSLDDPRTGLADFYMAYLGNDYQNTRNWLDKLKVYLKDPNHATGNDAKINDIAEAIKALQIHYRVKGKYNGRQSNYEYDVYQDDPLKLFLLAYLKDCVDPFAALRKDGTFYTDRLALEQALVQAWAAQSQPLQCPSSGLTANEQVIRINRQIKANPLWKALQNAKDCQQKLLWLGGGNFRMLPFANAAKYDWKKIFLFNQIIQQKVDSLKKCCENDPAKIEALIKSMNSGKSRFKISGGMILGYKDKAELPKMSFVNRILVPVMLKEDCSDCGVGYPNPYKYKWLINYDASQDYISDAPCLRPAVPEDEQLIIAVNNVPADKTAIISSTDVDIKDQSKAQAALSDIGGSVSSGFTALSPLSGIFTPVQIPPPNPRIRSQAYGETHPIAEHATGPDRTFFVLVNGKKFNFPGKVDLHSILQAIISKAPEKDQQALLKEADYFLANCNLVTINTSDKQHVTLGIVNLNQAFSDFVDFNVRNNADFAILQSNAVQLEYLLSSLDDVLPAKEVEPGFTDKPQNSTTLSTFDFIKAPKEKDYVIAEEAAKPQKPGAKPADNPSVADSIKTNMVKGAFKVGKRYLIQVSGGLAFTTQSYAENVPAFTNNSLSVTQKDQFASFVLGLNIYPWKAFNLDNNFMGFKTKRVFRNRWKSRLSIFTGIGIPDPTKNYFLGISDDLLPGVKITAGAHCLFYTKYQVTNDAITDQSGGFKAVAPFVGLNLDADFLGKLFSLFK